MPKTKMLRKISWKIIYKVHVLVVRKLNFQLFVKFFISIYFCLSYV